MNDFDNKHFINEIKIRPTLWDLRIDDYRDKYRKKRLWREVYSAVYQDYDKLSLEEKEILGEELQAKWKSLRDCYVRYLRNTNIKKGQPGKCVKEYVYAPYLEFLRPVTHVRKPGLLKQRLKSRVQDNMNDQETEYFLKDDDDDDSNNDDNDSVILIQNQNEKKVNGVEKGRPYIINMVRNKVKTSMECVNAIDNCELEGSIVSHETTDDDMDFFRSLLPFIKSLPLYQKISFRADIMKIAKEYADNLERSRLSLVENSLSSTSFNNSIYQKRMYLPVLPI